MSDFWNRVELANPPRHIQKKRKDAVCEWIPCAGSKRKLELTGAERDEEMEPSAKLFAVDETVQDYVLDSDGYMRGNFPTNPVTQNTTSTERATVTEINQQRSDSRRGSAELESMVVDESEEIPSTGLRECMVENETKGGGYKHKSFLGKSIGDGSVTYTSLILSNEVQNSMAERPVDISTVLAQQMVKQATMAVVLWKPLLPSPSPLDGVVSPPSSNSRNPVLPNSRVVPSNTSTNFVSKELNKNSNDEEMETTEEI